jgi:hypothetical protein
LAIVPPDPDRGNFFDASPSETARGQPKIDSGGSRTVPVKRICGEVAEWSKAHAWKVCRRGTVSRVRIPLSPPFVQIAQEKARKDAGEDYNKVLGDNAELLAKRLVERAKDDPASFLTLSPESGTPSKGKISANAGLVSASVKTEVDKDRRYVKREPSDKLLFSTAASEYLAQRVTEMEKQAKTSRPPRCILTSLSN